MRRLMISLCLACIGLVVPALSVSQEASEPQRTEAVDRYLELGTKKGELGGEEQKVFERGQIKTQIKTFIPPLLRPAFTQHAFVLPPRAYSVSFTNRQARINGGDFFSDESSNKSGFRDFDVERNLSDLDLFYGFDLDRKYLHGFTLRVNVPYLDSETQGFVHPNGQQFISLENAGSSQEIGDVGVFLKKKILDQGNFPIGLAAVGAVFLPTGANDETFGSRGRITAKRPQPPPVGAPLVPTQAEREALFEGFDAFTALNVANGVWNAPQCFFRNFNLAAGAGVCPNGPFAVPAGNAAMGPRSFAPGGANFGNAFVGDFPFNDGVFGRFSDDGRLPATLQPGTGRFGYLLGLFLTRQFASAEMPGRSAVHLGVTHRFVAEKDGIDLGDTTTFFASFVKPLVRDLLAVDVTFVGFNKQDDEYRGKIPEPEIHSCVPADIGVVAACGAVGDEVFTFELVDRPSFSGGFTGFVGTSLILSPDPQIRITLSTLFRVIEPDLGPAPDLIARAGFEVIF